MRSSAKILALSGGGVRGLYSATVIHVLEEFSGNKANQMFDVFAGTSVGGLVAVGLSLGMSADDIAQQIVAYAEDIFGHPARLNPMRIFRPKHDPARLARAIEAIISRKNTKLRLSDLPAPVILPAVCLTSNEIVYFSGEPIVGDRTCINSTVIDALMSTAAAPTYFPPHRIDDKSYVDGGVGVNSPDVDGLYFCRSTWFLPLEQIRLLSIGTGYKARETVNIATQNFGGYSWLKKHNIISLMIDLQENSASALAKDVLSERYFRVNSELMFSLELDEYDRTKLETLISTASKEVLMLLAAQPSRLAQFLN